MKVAIQNKALTKINKIADNIAVELFLSDKQKYKVNKILLNLYYIIMNRQFANINTDYYVNVNKSIFDRKCNRIKINNKNYHYRFFLEKLEYFKLIEINNKYCADIKNFTKSYRIIFSKDFSFKLVEIDFDILDTYKYKDYYLEKYPNLTNAIENLYDVNIDLDAYIEHLYSRAGENLGYKIKNGKKVKRILDAKKIAQYINEAILINFKKIWIKVSNEGRFYSSLTNLNKLALPFLINNNDNLSEIDVVNCQPLLLSTIVDDTLFKYDVEAGVFYDKIALYMNKERSEVKELLYRYIFFNNNLLKSGNLYDKMNILYPNLISKINKIKENSLLFEKLQNLESNIFIKGILKNTNRFCITRHDSIMCLEEDKEYFEFLIKKEFNKLKLNVKLK